MPSKASQCCTTTATFSSHSQSLESLCNKPSHVHPSETPMIIFFILVALSSLLQPLSRQRKCLEDILYLLLQGTAWASNTAPPLFLKHHWSSVISFSVLGESQTILKFKNVLVGLNSKPRLDDFLSQSQEQFPEFTPFAWHLSQWQIDRSFHCFLGINVKFNT